MKRLLVAAMTVALAGCGSDQTTGARCDPNQIQSHAVQAARELYKLDPSKVDISVRTLSTWADSSVTVGVTVAGGETHRIDLPCHDGEFGPARLADA